MSVAALWNSSMQLLFVVAFWLLVIVIDDVSLLPGATNLQNCCFQELCGAYSRGALPFCYVLLARG